MARPKGAPTYLKNRGGHWYAVLEIPPDLRPIVGKSRFMQSLGTETKKVALRRAARMIAGWRDELERAKGGDGLDDDEAFWRRKLRRATTEDQRRMVMAQIDLAAWSLGDGDSADPAAVEYRQRVTDVAFAEHLGEFLEGSGVTPKTQDMIAADVRRFAERFPTVRETTRKAVQEWASGLVSDGLTPKTVRRVMSGLRGYWRFLISKEVVPDDARPFDQITLPRKRRNGEQDRQPFSPGDVVKLVRAATAKGDPVLADLIRLAMWTGARRGELCNLTVADVGKGALVIRHGKTDAAAREVPVHPKLRPVVARLVKGKAASDYLLPVAADNKNQDRGDVLGKRFTRIKRELKFGPEYVFHSIRKTVATMLENAGVPEGVSADILGHEKQTMTYGLYSGGASLAVKAAALAKLSYPASAKNGL